MAILGLRDDARAYGQRMTEESQRLRRLARPVDWAGQAANATGSVATTSTVTAWKIPSRN